MAFERKNRDIVGNTKEKGRLEGTLGELGGGGGRYSSITKLRIGSK
jgi:hypothetical protein